jgi:hypothetical protein
VNIKNKRPTKIVADDLEDDEEVKKPVQRAKLHNWLNDVIMPSVDPARGYVKVIGTVLHEACEVLAFYRSYGGIIRRAIENGAPIWPQMYSAERLEQIKNGYIDPVTGMKKKGMGTRGFNKEYMNDPFSEEDAQIKRQWIEQAAFSVLPEDASFTAVIYIDPRAGKAASLNSDEYAITTLYARKNSPHRYVVEQTAGRISQLDQLKELVRTWLRHKRTVRAVGIEKVLNQTGLWQIADDWKCGRINLNNEDTPPGERIDERDRSMPIVEWSPEGKDKVARLELYEPDFERGEIHLRPEQEELREQAMFLASGSLEHDDRIDALIGALEMASRYGMRQQEKPDLTDEQKAKALADEARRRLLNKGFTGDLRKRIW